MTSSRTVARATVLWGGAGLAAAALLRLLPGLDATEPLLAVLGIAFGAALVQLAAAVVLTAGVRGRPGIAGRSGIGRIALLVFGAGPLVLGFGLSAAGGASIGVGTPVGDVLQLVVLAATVVAGLVVLRAGALPGAARWGLLVLAAVDAAGYALGWVPQAILLTIGWATVVQPAALLLLGALYVATGLRGAAVRRPEPVPEQG